MSAEAKLNSGPSPEDRLTICMERNAELVAALEAILAKDEHGFLITPMDNDLLEQAEKALANQLLTEKP